MIESNKPGDLTADKPVMLALESLNERPGELSSLEVDMATKRFPVTCLECGKKFKTASMMPYCPKCNSADVELLEPMFWDPDPNRRLFNDKEDFGGAFDGFTVTSDADGGL